MELAKPMPKPRQMRPTISIAVFWAAALQRGSREQGAAHTAQHVFRKVCTLGLWDDAGGGDTVLCRHAELGLEALWPRVGEEHLGLAAAVLQRVLSTCTLRRRGARCLPCRSRSPDGRVGTAPPFFSMCRWTGLVEGQPRQDRGLIHRLVARVLQGQAPHGGRRQRRRLPHCAAQVSLNGLGGGTGAGG